MNRAPLLVLVALLFACTDQGVIGHAHVAPDASAPAMQEPAPPRVSDAGDEPEAEPEPAPCAQTDASCQRCAGDDDCPGGECDDGFCRPEGEDEEEIEENTGDNSGPGGGDP